jgi:hypothetical protein
MEGRRMPRRVRTALLTLLVTGLVVGLPKEFGIRANPVEPLRKTAHHGNFRCAPSPTYEKGDPCRIVISSLGVDAKVIHLGLNADGTLEVPTDFSVTGWWRGGTRPGRTGPAVIVGHVDSFRGPAVFYRLKQLQPGDVVKVWRAGRPMVRFSVTGMREVPKDAFPTEQVYGDVPYAGLRLITCGGAFNHATGHYADNVIVFAQMLG